MYVRPDALQPERGSLEVTSTAPKAASSTPSGFYFLPHDELAALRAKVRACRCTCLHQPAAASQTA